MLLSAKVIENTRGCNQITGWLRMTQGLEGGVKANFHRSSVQ
jgi:hypothetical protein